MKEYPILFKGEMVRAILDGRKSQTRRLKGKHYKKGDRLWVKETARMHISRDSAGMILRPDPYCIEYKEGLDRREIPKLVQSRPDDYEFGGSSPHSVYLRMLGFSSLNPDQWRPSIFMPRWASRITLEITQDTYEEPLQDITETNACREGVKPCRCLRVSKKSGFYEPIPYSYRAGYFRLWNQINPKTPYTKNPTVLVHSFRILGNTKS